MQLSAEQDKVEKLDQDVKELRSKQEVCMCASYVLHIMIVIYCLGG